jgi:hypothetical protein
VVHITPPSGPVQNKMEDAPSHTTPADLKKPSSKHSRKKRLRNFRRYFEFNPNQK